MSATYSSQQAAFLLLLINYLQDPKNWPDGVPKATDFTPGSVLYTLLSADTVLGDTVEYDIWQARQAAYLMTATGDDLDNKAADYAIYRKPAVAATGTFTFTVNTPSPNNTNIPVGTHISTLPDSQGNVVVFETNTGSYLSAGQVSVDILATCQTAGASGNISANVQLVISSATPGIDGVSLSTSIINGIDIESDDSLRARALAAFAALARGTAAWYQSVALSITGVGSAIVVAKNRGPGTVDVYITGPNNSLPSNDIQTAVQSALDAGRPITDDAKVQIPTTITITATINLSILSGCDVTSVREAVQTAVINFITNLGIGAGTLGKIYALDLLTAAKSISGVVNATTTFIDTTISSTQLPQASTSSITITSS